MGSWLYQDRLVMQSLPLFFLTCHL
eukprot:CCRYP_017653-RD/>CCRYP_017653-RD protein AED:0.50 eAED:0.50 QI:0/-1/0/1/-1/0/1/0/24